MKKFERTAAAVRKYDKVNDKYFGTAGYVDGGLEAVEAALQKVREAFADDTSDINCRENAMLVSPDGNNGWLRKLLVSEGYEDCGLTKERRRQAGWGW